MGPWWSYVLASLPPTIAAVAALIVALRTHTAVNSRMDKALRAERMKGRKSEEMNSVKKLKLQRRYDRDKQHGK